MDFLCVKNANIYGEITNKMYDFISKENPEFLKKKGYSLVDMHYHSNHSDGAASVKEIIEKASNLGIGISITDHNEISGSLEAIDMKKDILIIPGIEVKSAELIDVLFYFYEKEDLVHFFYKEILPKRQNFMHTTKTDIPLIDLMRLQKKYRCISSVAHPFGYSIRTGNKKVMEDFGHVLKKGDFIEVMNGGNTRNQNIKAVELAIKENKGFTAGSDGHSIYALGKIMTCAKTKTVSGFLNNIKKRQNIIIGKENRFGKIGEYGRFAVNKFTKIFRR